MVVKVYIYNCGWYLISSAYCPFSINTEIHVPLITDFIENAEILSFIGYFDNARIRTFTHYGVNAGIRTLY